VTRRACSSWRARGSSALPSRPRCARCAWSRASCRRSCRPAATCSTRGPAQALPWEALRERLRARLGEDALYQLAGHPDPRPEQALRRDATLAREPAPLRLPPRPAWLLPRPMPLRDHALRVLAGPERIESGWWDGGDVRRDYYVVRTSLGQRAWAFLPAGVRDEGPASGWMLHGWFA
jgi:protein ImuB